MRIPSWGDNRGQSLVEFALILPIFILILFGLFDFGRAIFAYHTISSASREAARLAIVDQVPAHLRAEARASAVSLRIEDSQVDITFLSADESGPCDMSKSMYGCIAIIEVEYGYIPATPGIAALVGSLTLTASTHTPVESKCLDPATCPLGD